jgi:uncharacterized protein involved in exopolysaccharide biosynthesis
MPTQLLALSSRRTLTGGMLRQKKPALIVFLSIFSAVVVLTLALPSKYQSHLKILVKNERLNSLVSLDHQTQGLLYLDDISEARVNTEIALLTSSDVLRQVVRQTHLADEVSARVVSSERREELALANLQKNLDVKPIRKSNIIEVSYFASSAHKATEVLRALSSCYLAAQLRLNGAPGSYAFFENMALRYSTDLESSELRLAGFRKKNNIVELPQEKALALQRKTELEKDYQTSSSTTQADASQVASIQRSLATLPTDNVREWRDMPNQYSIERLNTLLVELQNKRAQLITRYRPDDRMVSEIDTQITETRRALDEATKSTTQEVSRGINPTYESTSALLVRARSDLAGVSAQRAFLASQLQSSIAHLKDLDEVTVQYDDMLREVKQIEDLSINYSRKAADAKAGELLDQNGIGNVAIAETPYESHLVASPHRGLILSLGFIWAALIAGATAFVLDRFSSGMSSPLELEKVLKAPLLATIPASITPPIYSGTFSVVYTAIQRT